MTAAVEPVSGHGTVAVVGGPDTVVGATVVVDVMDAGARVVAVVVGVVGVVVVADLPLPPPHEARTRANALTR